MVDSQIASRGVHDDRVLDAVRRVPREMFLDTALAEFAYEDVPLPIGAGETISQPLVVAMLAQSAEIDPEDSVLEIGAGSGYGAAVLGLLGGEVWTVERHRALAEQAERRLAALGLDRVHVVSGDGSLGLPSAAPFDAVVVTAIGHPVTDALREQLVEGGRLVAVSAPDERCHVIRRFRRLGGRTVEEDPVPLRLVPTALEVDPAVPALAPPERTTVVNPPGRSRVHGLAELVREAAEPFPSVEGADLAPLLERIGGCSVVLLGEATHGTSEFYRLRDRITRELVSKHGFVAVAVEADWPDAARIDRFVRNRPARGPDLDIFSRFPTWMWRNHEVGEFVRWLRDHNDLVEDPAARVSFHGLDLYSLYSSRAEVIDYLDRVDPEAADLARHRYSCLSPWQQDPAEYGRAVVTGRFAGCETAVVATLSDLLRRRLDYSTDSGDDYLDAAQNAAIVANAERYYRAMYSGSRASWNLRDQHMFETLQVLRSSRGPDAKIVVWEHNSHVGDASATEMGARGEHNVGMLCRRQFGDDAYLVGFGTDHGTVAAATKWGGPMRVEDVRPSHPRSYERVCHDSGVPAFFLRLREPRRDDVRVELGAPRLERAIGVIYRPETELRSHYFEASLPSQFDEYVWIDETTAVHPLPARVAPGDADTFPSGL